jgi:hypothetical protein
MGIVKGQHYQLLINFSTGMTKVTKPIKKFWESDKKPDCMVLSKTGKDSGIVRIKRLKNKKRSRGSGLKELGVK